MCPDRNIFEIFMLYRIIGKVKDSCVDKTIVTNILRELNRENEKTEWNAVLAYASFFLSQWDTLYNGHAHSLTCTRTREKWLTRVYGTSERFTHNSPRIYAFSFEPSLDNPIHQGQPPTPPLPYLFSLSLSHSLFPHGFFFILLGCDRRVFIAMCPWNSDNDRLTFPALSNSAAPVTAAAPFRSDWRLSIFCFCFFFFHGFVSLLRQHYTRPLLFPPRSFLSLSSH